MEQHHLTTSFGRRPTSLGQVATQFATSRAINARDLPGSNAPVAVNKWTLFRTLTAIREHLGVSDRALSVLNALLSFHPETALTLPKIRAAENTDAADYGDDGQSEGEGADAFPCDLVVFPSNKALAARAHGMADRTLLRHLTDLVEAGLIIRRDSPNGKRYARKDASGQDRFSHAFGFDLTPLVVRAGEFESLADEQKALARQRYLRKERISLLRRDVSKLIGMALDEGLAGDWEALRCTAMTLMTPLRRIRDDRGLAALEANLTALRTEITKTLKSCINAQNSTGNDRHNDAHLSNSNTNSHSDSEPAFNKAGGNVQPRQDTTIAPVKNKGEVSSKNDRAGTSDKPDLYPLGMVMEACPDVRDYAPQGVVKSWNDFLTATATIRPMIGISLDAWTEVQDVLGRIDAHIVVATILQRSEFSSEAENLPGDGNNPSRIVVNGSPAIRSAGGYLRALTDKARAGEFALGPVLMALIGQRLRKKRMKE
jgi:replication initiation protein RepC